MRATIWYKRESGDLDNVGFTSAAIEAMKLHDNIVESTANKRLRAVPGADGLVRLFWRDDVDDPQIKAMVIAFEEDMYKAVKEHLNVEDPTTRILRKVT